MDKVTSWSATWKRGNLIGEGAFAKVYLALDMENGHLSAVKSVECHDGTREEKQDLENEIEMLQGLNSPFIVKCLGSSTSVEEDKIMLNLFMEYMSGGSMAVHMKEFEGYVEEPLIKKYTRSILEGIRYLHSRDIVHCDIKCRNVLVGIRGKVKLADFGGAKRLNGEAAVMGVLNPKGTQLWMAPEVLRKEEQGPASDIWSLGCTVAEMATGKTPWKHIRLGDMNKLESVIYHIGHTKKALDLPSCLSDQGQDFLRKCLQRDPRARWTAGQLLQHPFIANKPTEACYPISPTNPFDFPVCVTQSI